MQTFANEIENSPDVSIEENQQVTPKFSLDEKSIEGKTYKATRRTALGSIFLSYSGMLTLGFMVDCNVKCNKRLHTAILNPSIF